MNAVRSLNVCPDSGTYSYPTRERAEMVIDLGVFLFEGSHPRGVYECGDHWHLTSQTPKRYYRRPGRLTERVRAILTGE